MHDSDTEVVQQAILAQNTNPLGAFEPLHTANRHAGPFIALPAAILDFFGVTCSRRPGAVWVEIAILQRD